MKHNLQMKLVIFFFLFCLYSTDFPSPWWTYLSFNIRIECDQSGIQCTALTFLLEYIFGIHPLHYFIQNVLDEAFIVAVWVICPLEGGCFHHVWLYL